MHPREGGGGEGGRGGTAYLGSLGEIEVQRVCEVGGQPGQHGVVKPVIAEVRVRECSNLWDSTALVRL